MRALSDAELLNVWERGLGQGPSERALSLLAGFAGMSADDWAQQSIGRRDAALLKRREQLFGSRIHAVAVCPECGETVEFSFDAAKFLIEPSALESPLSLNKDGWQLQFRLPNSLDIAAIEGAASGGVIHDARATLLSRCMLTVQRFGDPIAADNLPPEIVDAVSRTMAEADPQADVRLDCECPQCGHHWQTLFDVVSFLWSEIAVWAKRTLREIHVLASAYGWREADVLALGPTRRGLYLEMVIE